MDKEKALSILDLTEEASPEDIEKRISVLYKKFKNIKKDDRGYTILDVDEAYKTLMGITFMDPEAEAKRQKRKENPNPIFKLLKIDEEKARNFFYYYKWHMLGTIVAIIAIVATITSIVKNVDPDLKILITGNLYVDNPEIIAEDISKRMEEVEKAQVLNVYLSGRLNSQADMAMQTKFTIEIAVGENDIYIVDEEKYFQLAKQGAFKPIEDMLGNLSSIGIDYNKQDDLVLAIETDDENKYEPKLYGIDVSNSEYLRESGIIGERFILCFGLSGKYPENAKNFVIDVLK